MKVYEQSPDALRRELESTKKLVQDLQTKLERVEKNTQVRPRAKRKELQSPVEFIGDFDIVHADGINISDDGVSFEVKRPLPIEMHYLEDGVQKRRRAHLVWMKHLPEKGYRFGLKFVTTDLNSEF
jgi:hypothetical protein